MKEPKNTAQTLAETKNTKKEQEPKATFGKAE